jgi:hypothetical protein
MSEHDKKPQPDPYAEESVSPATTTDLDASYEAYKSHEGSPIDPEEAKRVLRKVDMRIVPILFVVYLLQYLDKNSLNFAAAYGFQKGTHLHGQQYSWLGTYARVQIPRVNSHHMEFRLLSSSPTLPVSLQSVITSNRESKEIVLDLPVSLDDRRYWISLCGASGDVGSYDVPIHVEPC